MPTVLRIKGYRFFFYSNDHTPIHIHVEKAEATAKFSLEPVHLLKSNRFNAKEMNELSVLVKEHKELFKEKWNEYFSN